MRHDSAHAQSRSRGGSELRVRRRLGLQGGRAAEMIPSGRLGAPLVVLGLLLCWAPRTLGRRSDVRVITEENWRDLLEGEWMLEL